VRPIPALTPRVAAAVLAALLVGCTGEPTPTPTPSPSLDSTPLPAADPDREALEGMVAELRATVTALRSELEAAAAGDAAALRTAADLLVADVDAVTTGAADGDDGGGGFSDSTDTGSTADPTTDPDDDADGTPPAVDLDGPAPVLPGPLASRAESIQYGDLLTRTMATARGAGTQGEPVLRFLADPLAGDLGAWQRAPADQLAAIARAGTAGDLAALETAVLDLGGEAPRALAWVVHGLAEPADADDAAGRALAHLAIIELSLEQLE